MLLTDKLGKKEYRDVYIDLNSASVPESKVFITDIGADGLKAENSPYDTYDNVHAQFALDSARP